MNSFVSFACLLVVVGVCHASAIGGYGYGPIITPVLAPAAVSTQNLWKAPPIPIVKTVLAPIISAPIIKTVPISPYGLGPVISPLGLGLSGLGLNGVGLNGLGLGYGLGGKWH